ncbi:hypothetical protein [Cellulomonas sp. SG140]|uniref:hypothetical protein n=1 Tax=Cellulomonas sp. SG140 TaxID=2976536 RepID=UPI0021E74B80|nr:hypothetical protein [Cellulomonas sp. SG140]
MTTTGAVAVELYGLPLEQFTAARDARAKELRRDGDRTVAAEVARLPRPSVAAWAVDLLVRHERDLVEQLVELGAALREAQETLAGEQLRELDQERRRLLRAIGQRARALAEDQGLHLSESVLGQVQATVHAAMADPGAAAAVRSGVLTRSLETSGFGPVDLDGAVAVVDAAPLPHTRRAAPDIGAGDAEQHEEEPRRHREERRDAELSKARADLAEAERVDRRAAEQAATARRAAEELDERRAALAERAEVLRHELQAVQDENDELTMRLTSARGALREATTASRSAGRTAERARDRVERLEREGAHGRPS